MLVELAIIILVIKSQEISGFKAPQIKPFHFSGDLRIGLRTGVSCIVEEGDPPFDFKWLKDGLNLQETSGLTIKLVDEFSSMLFIKSLGAESNGNYTCKVSNSAGWDEKSDILNMKGEPC
ncbi:titin [Trichonephila clavata]|uniref:Titin n=1 Tax=Trichonephila clavata TaxID=2740835 RepID=A0A8X6HRG4_TRICU|nr:titin [Trichonephila clavata]